MEARLGRGQQSVGTMAEQRDIVREGRIDLPDTNPSATIAQEQWDALVTTARNTGRAMILTRDESGISIASRDGTPVTTLPKVPDDRIKSAGKENEKLMQKRRQRQNNMAMFSGFRNGRVYENGRIRRKP